MLTFQILDGGETTYWPLEDRAVAIGSGAGADLRLTEEGVAPLHAEVLPADPSGYRLVAAGDAEVRVNGEPVRDAELQLGDRVEIGKAVLVLGQEVARRATADDVLGDRLALGARRIRRDASSRLAIAIVVAGVLAVIAALLWFDRDDTPPLLHREQAVQRKAGRFDQTRELLRRIRGDWARERASRNAVVDAAERQLDATERATDALRARVQRDAATQTYAEQVRGLKEREQIPGAEGEAARIVRGELSELRASAPVRGQPPTEAAVAPMDPSVLAEAARVRAATPRRDPVAPDAEPRAPVSPAPLAGAEPEPPRPIPTDPQDAHWLSELTRQVNERLRTEREIEVRLPGGGLGRLAEVDGDTLVVHSSRGTRRVPWHDMPPRSIRALASGLSNAPQALLGAAVVCYRYGDERIAESCLASALESDPSLERAVWDVIRRGRADHPDPDGYRLVDGGFVGHRELRVEQLATEQRAPLRRAFNGTAQQRASFVASTLAAGPEATEALRTNLRDEQEALALRLRRHPFRNTGYAAVARQREQLEKARRTALELIFDEEKYFYPFEPPAVERDVADAYAEIQDEVARRVAAVRALWLEAPAVAIPDDLQRGFDAYRWTTETLGSLGIPQDDDEARIAWVVTLPDGGELHVRNFAGTLAQRRTARLWDRIAALNRARRDLLTDSEWRQAELTNDYRRMMGRTPLVLDSRIQGAARAHSEEMRVLQYLGHFSPAPGQRTPFDRMRAAGYPTAAAENCAVGDSPDEVHQTLLGSSAHHRNLLADHHTEFGIGQSEAYWTQNFGGGEDYLRALSR